jgi:ubiquinone/menaquinone biosynthesis C-methylase UbiE
LIGSSYDSGADRFDERAGLSPEVCAEIAREVLTVSNLQSGELLLEIGAGTGQIGLELSARHAPYVALDRSDAMLEKFRRRLSQSAGASLLVADANRPWPVADGTVGAIFGSRVLHLLDSEHVVREIERVRRQGPTVILAGRVEREPSSVRQRLRRRMRELAAELGPLPREAGRRIEALFEACQRAGGHVLPEREVAIFTVSIAPARVLEAWQNKPDLAKAGLPPSEQREILAEVERWARDVFGDIAAPQPSLERYVLLGAQF